jgi:hypothetical protein
MRASRWKADEKHVKAIVDGMGLTMNSKGNLVTVRKDDEDEGE